MQVMEAGEMGFVFGLRLEIPRRHSALALSDQIESCSQLVPPLPAHLLLPLWTQQPSFLKEISDPLGNDLALGAERQRS